MLVDKVKKAVNVWSSISEILYVLHTEEEYQELVDLLDSLIDEVGEDETHPLASLMEIIGVLIEKYENEHIPEITEKQLIVLALKSCCNQGKTEEEALKNIQEAMKLYLQTDENLKNLRESREESKTKKVFRWIKQLKI